MTQAAKGSDYSAAGIDVVGLDDQIVSIGENNGI
jgi:hypothetical protein